MGTSTIRQGTQEDSHPPVQPKIGRQTCWEGLWKLSQRAQGLACGHRIDVLQVRFKPISAAAKPSVFSFPTRPLIPKPKETGRLDPFTATRQNRISPGRPNLSNPRLSLMSKAWACVFFKGREGRECDAVHPLSALGEEWDAGPATVPVWSSGPSPIQAADEINLASDKFPPSTGIPGSHVLRWFFCRARHWAEYYIQPENNRSYLPGSAVSTFPGLSSFNPQNSPETRMTIHNPSHATPQLPLRPQEAETGNSDTNPPRLTQPGRDAGGIGTQTVCLPNPRVSSPDDLECLVHLSQGQVPAAALLFFAYPAACPSAVAIFPLPSSITA